MPQENHIKLEIEPPIQEVETSLGSCVEQIWVSTEYKSPEQMLWINVLLLFIRDAQRDYDRYKKSTNGKSAMLWEIVCENAKLVQHEYIEEICEYADIDYAKLKQTIMLISCGKLDLELPEKGRWF